MPTRKLVFRLHHHDLLLVNAQLALPPVIRTRHRLRAREKHPCLPADSHTDPLSSVIGTGQPHMYTDWFCEMMFTHATSCSSTRVLAIFSAATFWGTKRRKWS